MGVVYSTLLRKVRRFNVENRALRAIERDKPVVAPRHPSSKKFYDEIMEDHPEARKELETKNPKLDEHLKNVYVTSTNSEPEIPKDRTMLPQNRKPVIEDEFGFWQPNEIPTGQASLANILKFLADHQGDPQLWTASAIAKQYNLDEKKVGNVLEYYKTFNLYMPTIPDNKAGMYSMKRLVGKVTALVDDGKNKDEKEKEQMGKT